MVDRKHTLYVARPPLAPQVRHGARRRRGRVLVHHRGGARRRQGEGQIAAAHENERSRCSTVPSVRSDAGTPRSNPSPRHPPRTSAACTCTCWSRGASASGWTRPTGRGSCASWTREVVPGARADLVMLDHAAMVEDFLTPEQDEVDIMLARATSSAAGLGVFHSFGAETSCNVAPEAIRACYANRLSPWRRGRRIRQSRNPPTVLCQNQSSRNAGTQRSRDTVMRTAENAPLIDVSYGDKQW